MSLHFKASETWEIGSDANLTQTNSKRSSSLIESVDIVEHGGGFYKLAAGATNESIAFGPVTTAYALRIETDQPITAKINGATTALPIGRNEDTKAVLQLSQTAGITSLSLSNPSSKEAEVYISLPGV